MTRKLATIQKINSIEPIEGADKLEKVSVLGWEIVAEKGLHQIGDYIVYCEIDSFLPERPEFEFLRERCFKNYGGRGGFRLRTIKLRGQVSQGLILPLSVYTNGDKRKMDSVTEGLDVTDELGIIKYDSDLLKEMKEKENHQRQYTKKWKGKGLKGLFYRILFWFKVKLGVIKYDKTFPSFIIKTDEERVQNIQKLLDTYMGTECSVKEKIDGSSITCYIKKGKFGVCSRNLDLTNKDNYYWRTVEKLGIENIMRTIRPAGEIALQGELVGPSIQGNKYKLDDYTIYWFNIYDIKRQIYYSPSDFAIDSYGLKIVPDLGTIRLHNNIKERVEYSKGKSTLNKDTHREGIVIRPLVDIYNIRGMYRLSFKVINPDFLLKYDE